MSGGHFNYNQYVFSDIKEDLDILLEKPFESEDVPLDELQEHIYFTKQAVELARICVHRLDWFLSGDDSWDTYKERLKEEIENMEEA